MKLPNAGQALVEREKIVDYLLRIGESMSVGFIDVFISLREMLQETTL